MISLLTQCDESVIELVGIDGERRQLRRVHPSGTTRVDLFKTDVRATIERFRPEPDFMRQERWERGRDV